MGDRQTDAEQMSTLEARRSTHHKKKQDSHDGHEEKNETNSLLTTTFLFSFSKPLGVMEPVPSSTASATTRRGRKRPRAPSPTKTSSATEDEALVQLTPHTLRLLKLIEEGTTEYARLAATQLVHIVRQSSASSSLILWDILGRLQGFLTRAEWQTRHNASIAMMGIAQQLPIQDQQEFLQQTSVVIRESTTEQLQEEQQHHWLTVDLLQQQLPLVLREGRTLLASADSKYDGEEEGVLSKLDHSLGGTNALLPQRIELQRKILARRLGLSAALTFATGNAVDDFLSPDDFDISKDPSSTTHKTAKSKPSPPSSSVRSLLVQEMHLQEQRQHLQDTSTRNSTRINHELAISHKNAQSLLATELVFRMFDASWHVRHGSLLGLLALLRAWKVYLPQGHTLGRWPQDILARCIAILALDRFADFSESSIQSTAAASHRRSSQIMSSGGIVAPVREMAGQVLSVVYLMAPDLVQRQVYHTLEGLARQQNHDDDWEIRYGSLVALKYLATVVLSLITKKDKPQELCPVTTFLIKGTLTLAKDCLKDTSLDVQGAAADLVRTILIAPSDPNMLLRPLRPFLAATVPPLWKAIQPVQLISSSIKNLVATFSSLVAYDMDLVTNTLNNTSNSQTPFVSDMLSTLARLLKCPYPSVRVAVLQVIGVTTSHLAVQWESFWSSDTAATRHQKANAAQSFCDLALALFHLSDEWLILNDKLTNNREDIGGSRNEQLPFHQACQTSWKKLAKASSTILDGFGNIRYEMEKEILLAYFGLQSSSQEASGIGSTIPLKEMMEASSGHRHKLQVELADAIATCLVESLPSQRIETHNMVEFCLHVGIKSPVISHYERACFLFSSLASKNHGQVFASILDGCREMLLANMTHEDSPVCLHINHPKLLEVLSPTRYTTVFIPSFHYGMGKIVAGTTSIAHGVEIVDKLWKESIRDCLESSGYIPSTRVTIDSMRICALSASTLVSGGSNFFPQKLTPLVRALMTSIQNEADNACRQYSTNSLAEFLHLLSSDSSTQRSEAFAKTFSKVVQNLCRVIAANKPPSCASASSVVSLAIRRLQGAHSLEKGLLRPVWEAIVPLTRNTNIGDFTILGPLLVLRAVSNGLHASHGIYREVIHSFLERLISLLTESTQPIQIQELLSESIRTICAHDQLTTSKVILPILGRLVQTESDSTRIRACKLLQEFIASSEMSICPFVRSLLPLSMSLMTDPAPECAHSGASIFSKLVQLAPLVESSAPLSLHRGDSTGVADRVMDHLIQGKPLPPCDFHPSVSSALGAAGVALRPYQLEGVSWLRFLQSVRLNGALTDSMGLGKTLQCLVGIALCHADVSPLEKAKSLVVCPSSVVGHWMQEIKRFFPGGKVFVPFSVHADGAKDFGSTVDFGSYNIVVSSYSSLRRHPERFCGVKWQYCVLDEGHLLKNPKTATAMAARRIRARHRLVLTGTPVQNKVHEVWATFDFLMPNFLGSSKEFSKEFARPIVKSQAVGASARDIALGMEKLKSLHQQVLPLILRREKEQVLRDLPPKTITMIPCNMSPEQESLYKNFCSGSTGIKTVAAIQSVIQDVSSTGDTKLGSDVLKALLYLRLLCTHPGLVAAKEYSDDLPPKIEGSGKLIALRDLLYEAGIGSHFGSAADNDRSLLYIPTEEEAEEVLDEATDVLEVKSDGISFVADNAVTNSTRGSKCLIFAQFTHSLNIIEDTVLKPYFPETQYLRLDGQIPPSRRSEIVNSFNQNEDIRVLLLTTRIGGLGLNLTGADTVIFIEHDWNPHADLQAMDRAHRIGQDKPVSVYKLITTNSIEEKIMKLHETKIAMSKAIVNSENSSLYSMGTDRLLDIFRFRSTGTNGTPTEVEDALDSLLERYEGEYSSLSLQEFIEGFDDIS